MSQINKQVPQEGVSVQDFLINHEELNAIYRFPADFFPFQGHFPDQPILPGFITMAVMEHAVPTILNRELKFIRAKKVKFTGMVLPDQEVHVHLSKVKEEEHQLQVSIEVSCEQTIVSKAQLSFEII